MRHSVGASFRDDMRRRFTPKSGKPLLKGESDVTKRSKSLAKSTRHRTHRRTEAHYHESYKDDATAREDLREER